MVENTPPTNSPGRLGTRGKLVQEHIPAIVDRLVDIATASGDPDAKVRAGRAIIRLSTRRVPEPAVTKAKQALPDVIKSLAEIATGGVRGHGTHGAAVTAGLVLLSIVSDLEG